VRETAGLSLAELARRTPYSKSSWARYLAGSQPVPRPAVEALCAVAGVRPDRLLALWELADARWSGRARTSVEAAEEPRPGRRGTPYVWGAAAALAAAACAALLLLPHDSSPASAQSAVATPKFRPGCEGRDCDGKNPVDMACGGQDMIRTLAACTTPDGRRVQLRDGRACRAIWVRATHLRMGDRVELTLPGTPRKEIRVDDADDLDAYLATPMTGMEPTRDPAEARVCLIPAHGRRVCFTGRS
jgi:hypothetical protein